MLNVKLLSRPVLHMCKSTEPLSTVPSPAVSTCVRETGRECVVHAMCMVQGCAELQYHGSGRRCCFKSRHRASWQFVHAHLHLALQVSVCSCHAWHKITQAVEDCIIQGNTCSVSDRWQSLPQATSTRDGPIYALQDCAAELQGVN